VNDYQQYDHFFVSGSPKIRKRILGIKEKYIFYGALK